MNKSVLFVGERGQSASTYYRQELPARYLRSKGWSVALTNSVYETDDGTMIGYEQARGLVLPTKYVVCRRMLGPEGRQIDCSSMFEHAHKAGQIIIIDLDDDSWHVPFWNPAYGQMTKEDMRLWEQDMQAAFAISVSTESLGNSVMNRLHDKQIWYVENGVDSESYAPLDPNEHSPIRLGWLGTTGHRGADFKVVRDALYEALKDRMGEVEFWHLGYYKDHPPIGTLCPDMPVVTKSVDWVDTFRLPEVLRLIDVAIVPQRPCIFANSRSNVTGLALAAAGVPFAATQTPEYQRLWKLGVGYPADSHKGWVHAIQILTRPEYKEVRADMRTAGLLATHGPWNYKKTGAQWEAMLNACY